MSIIISAIKIIFLIGFLVFIHEGGHFLVAKACKVVVQEFSIGFGPKIWKKETKETKYSLGIIPFGGYVQMLGESEKSDEEGSFSRAKISQRAAIVLAGPIVNIVFGLVVYFILAAVSGLNLSTFVADIVDISKENIGSQIVVGDEILEINPKDPDKLPNTRLDINPQDPKLPNVRLDIKPEDPELPFPVVGQRGQQCTDVHLCRTDEL